MSEYIFEEHRDDRERRRLQLIEHALDSETIVRLKTTGVQACWHCLELGAGAGSIAEWMGGVVGEQGRVVAVDINTNHVQHLSGPPYTICKGDFLEVALDGEFDLAHCRYVLIHNRRSQPMLKKLCALLKPGGFLVIEEPDFTSARLFNRQGDPSQQRVNNAICRMFDELQLNPAYGLSLPATIAVQGFQIVEVDSRLHLARGGSAMARMMAASTRALAAKYVATGRATDSDIEAYTTNAANDRFWAAYYATISVVARKTSG